MSLLNNLEIEKKIPLKDKPHTSSFVFHHLPEDMGVVLGNYLRQLLMKYTTGTALLGIKISDKDGPAKAEVGILSGVFETIPHFIVNLKNIIVEQKKEKEGIFCLELNIENKEKKEKVIKAGDFQNKDIEIKNPDLPVATLAVASSGQANPKLEVKLYFQKS